MTWFLGMIAGAFVGSGVMVLSQDVLRMGQGEAKFLGIAAFFIVSYNVRQAMEKKNKG